MKFQATKYPLLVRRFSTAMFIIPCTFSISSWEMKHSEVSLLLEHETGSPSQIFNKIIPLPSTPPFRCGGWALLTHFMHITNWQTDFSQVCGPDWEINHCFVLAVAVTQTIFSILYNKTTKIQQEWFCTMETLSWNDCENQGCKSPCVLAKRYLEERGK